MAVLPESQAEWRGRCSSMVREVKLEVGTSIEMEIQRRDIAVDAEPDSGGEGGIVGRGGHQAFPFIAAATLYCPRACRRLQRAAGCRAI